MKILGEADVTKVYEDEKVGSKYIKDFTFRLTRLSKIDDDTPYYGIGYVGEKNWCGVEGPEDILQFKTRTNRSFPDVRSKSDRWVLVIVKFLEGIDPETGKEFCP